MPPTEVEVVQAKTPTAVMVGRMLGAVTAPLLWSWPLMLLIGMIHAEVSPSIPALGYWQTVLVKVTLALLLPVKSPDYWLWTKRRARTQTPRS